MSVSVTFEATPCGKVIAGRLADGATPANLTALDSGDEVQRATINSLPAGSAFSLAGCTPIGVTPLPPTTYCDWTLSGLTPGRAVLLAAHYIPTNDRSTSARYEVRDGAAAIGSATINQKSTVGGFTDETLPLPNSTLGVWMPLGSFTPSGTSLVVRLTGPYENWFNLCADAIRVEDSVTHVATVVDDSTPGKFAAVGNWNPEPTGIATCYGSSQYVGTGEGIAARYAIDVPASQAKIEAVLGAGNVILSATGADSTGPFTVRFAGDLAGAGQSLLTSSDASVVLSRTTAGGQFPVLHLNGDAIPLRSPMWWPGFPFVFYRLHLSAKPVQYRIVDQAGMFRASGWIFPQTGRSVVNLEAASASPYYGFSSTVGAVVAKWQFQQLPDGDTFQVAVTWLSDPSYSAAAKYTVTDDAGNVLGGPYTVSQKAEPASYTADAVPWHIIGSFTTPADGGITVKLANGDADPITCDAVRLARTSPDASVIIGPDDVPTIDLVEGWASTSAGPLPAATGHAIVNRSGANSLVPFVEGPKTMRVGYNVLGANASLPCPIYANPAKTAQFDQHVMETDEVGNPTLFDYHISQSLLIGYQEDGSGLGRGLPASLPGDYTLLWDGPVNSLSMFDSGTTVVTEKTGLAVATGAANNKRVYTLADPINFGPLVPLQWNNTPDGGGNFTNGATNIRVYGPEIDLADPPVFHPRASSKLDGAKILRFMDARGTIAGSARDVTDELTPDRMSFFEPMRRVNAPIASITGYVGADTYFDQVNTTVLQVTTTVPHTLEDGQISILQPATAEADFTVHFSDGSTRDLRVQGPQVIRKIDATTFLMCIRRFVPNTPMVNTLTGGFATASIGGGGMPIRDCCRLCNEKGADLWLNVANTASDAAMVWLGQQIALYLDAGLKIFYEFCNEPWNTVISGAHLVAMTSQLPGYAGVYTDPFPYYVKRSGETFAGLLTGLGSRASDARNVLGTNGSNGSNTLELIERATAYGTPLHAIAVAPYQNSLDALGWHDELIREYDRLDADQCRDLYEYTIEHAGLDSTVSGARAMLDSAGFTDAEVISYEGSANVVIPVGSFANYSERSYEVMRHPRMFWIELRRLQTYEDAGMTIYTDYAFNIGLGKYQFGQYPSMSMWNTWHGLTVAPGTGDPIADADGINHPLDLARAPSQVGGALLHWASLYDGSYVPPEDPPTRTPARWGRLRRARVAS